MTEHPSDAVETLIEILESFDGGDWASAKQVWITCCLEADDRVWVWGFFDSRQRAFLKGDERKYLDDYLGP